MVVRLTLWNTVSGVMAIAISTSGHALAQEVSSPNDDESQSVLERVEDVLFNESGPYFNNQRFGGALDYIIGPYPENRIERDAEGFHQLYRELMALQTLEDPFLRAPDLPNPFTTTLQNAPSLRPVYPPVEPAPPLVPPPAFTTPPRPPESTRPPVQQRGPVRALY